MTTIKEIQEVGAVVISSAFPDLTITTDKKFIDVNVLCQGDVIFSTTLYPYNGQVKLFDLRRIIELHMREKNLAMCDFTVETRYQKTKLEEKTYSVVYCDINFAQGISYPDLAQSFLTTLSSKVLYGHAPEMLSFILAQGETYAIDFELVARDTDQKLHHYAIEHAKPVTASQAKVLTFYFTVDTMTQYLHKGETLLSAVVRIGPRMFTYYFSEAEGTTSFMFRNAFNCWECATPRGKTTTKTAVSRQLVVRNHECAFYDKTIEKDYQMETAALGSDVAQWLEQFVCSDKVMLYDPTMEYPEDMTPVLITDSTCEYDDDDTEPIRFKFTYRLASDTPHLPKFNAHNSGIFTEQFTKEFN